MEVVKTGNSYELRELTQKELLTRQLKNKLPPFANREEAMRIAWWLAESGLTEVAEEILKQWSVDNTFWATIQKAYFMYGIVPPNYAGP